MARFKQTTMETIYSIALLFCRLVIMNLLWFGYTLLGGVVFGLVPATVTLVEVFRAYEREGDAFKWVQRSWEYYKANLKRFWWFSAIWCLVVVSGILSWQTLRFQGNPFEWVVAVVLVYLMGLVLPFLASNEANFTVTRMQLLRNSVQLPFMWPLTSLKIMAVEIITVIICTLLPGLIPIMAFSVPLFLASAFLTLRWNKQLSALGMETLPISREQDATEGANAHNI